MTSAILLLFVAMISIQVGAGFAKSLFPLVGAAGTTGLRLFFATAILWIIWRPWNFRFDKPTIKSLMFYGGSLGLMNLTFYFSLQRIPLGLAVTLEFIGPLTLSILTSRKKMDFLWVALAAAGIYLVMPHSNVESTLDILGVIFALVAGSFWALYIFFGQRAGNALHGGIAATAGMTVATIVALPFGLALDGPRMFNPEILPLALFVASLSSALPYSLEMVALKRLPTKTFGILMSLEPAIASMVGLVLLKEQLLLTQWIAIIFIIIASLGSVLGVQKNIPVILPEI
jgi:inner membrane transporter RhtA